MPSRTKIDIHYYSLKEKSTPEKLKDKLLGMLITALLSIVLLYSTLFIE